MTLERIHQAIPHRAPMLLVDEVIEESADRIICRKRFAADEFFFQGHYPEASITPGVILCEAAMQAGAILLSQHLGGAAGVPVATRLNNVKFKSMVLPGDTIEMQVELTERLADAFYLNAKVTNAGKLAVRFDFACTLAPAPAPTPPSA
ncbi:MAG: 3-hydroxyacyl-ACP dehydratase FabZ family protein [Pirellulaceae bacterium]|jgi:3-hydroxyacyl-[acyl-carrier-protein] dehydratase|nr:3-hydroxyacyl-ACP dehydratase FabZ family protein [Pirellulaceae bacterium]MDP7018692.1 3-hydroxyacyl-ACP dehydratase FabZ family protein [Pirellulaceae bacterium]